MQCSYGSIWRKWDFHVHTPYSILNNNYGFNPFELTESDLETEFDEYVKKLFTLAVENNVAAIGITDYFMLEGYKRIKEKYLSSPSKMLQCFPDDELRRKIEKIFILNIRLKNHDMFFQCPRRFKKIKYAGNSFFRRFLLRNKDRFFGWKSLQAVSSPCRS